jgi:hypothetical protein
MSASPFVSFLLLTRPARFPNILGSKGRKKSGQISLLKNVVLSKLKHANELASSQPEAAT